MYKRQVLKYFNYKKPDLSKEEIIFGYAGVITFERGINKLLDVSISIADKFPQKKFKLLLFGRFTYQGEEIEFKKKAFTINNLEVEFAEWTDYDKMSSVIERMDICCLLYTSPSPRDRTRSRMPSSA